MFRPHVSFSVYVPHNGCIKQIVCRLKLVCYVVISAVPFACRLQCGNRHL